MADHKHALLKLCGENVNKNRVKYCCDEHNLSLKAVFSINIDPEVHPCHFCQSCYATLTRKLSAMREKRTMVVTTIPVQWLEHGNLCETCERYEQVMKGGRPKKKRGFPTTTSCHSLIEHTKVIAPPSLYDSQSTLTIKQQQLIDLSEAEYTCKICHNLLNSPVEISTCSTLVCAQCLIQWFENSQTNQCPSCSTANHQLECSEISPLNDLHLRVLEGILITCAICKADVRLVELKHHLKSRCKSSTSATRSACDLVKSMVVGNELQLPTGGHVSYYLRY